MKILDATCGFKGIWYQKNHPFVTFMDKRQGTTTNTQNTKLKNKRYFRLNPDVVSEWKNAPFPDDYFDMIVFDPPHLIIEKGKQIPTLALRYGYLNKHNWRQVLKVGVEKLFDILKPNGIFILKWCEASVRIEEVLDLCPYPPLFGSNTKSKGHTANFWILFIKHNVNSNLNNYLRQVVADDG